MNKQYNSSAKKEFIPSGSIEFGLQKSENSLKPAVNILLSPQRSDMQNMD